MTVVSDYRALLRILDNENAAWNAGTGIGAPVIVSYRFIETGDLPAPSSVEGEPGSVLSFTSAQRRAFRDALDEAEAVAGIRFVESGEEAMINVFGVMNMDAAGRASYPAVNDTFTSSGDLYVDFDRGTSITGRLFEVVLHELGHGLGLKHPHSGGLTLEPSLDTSSQTVMTYNDEPTPMSDYRPLDVEALQHLYGESVADNGWSLRMSGSTLIARGSASGDTMIGVGGTNKIYGQAGRDKLIGRDGDDTLSGGAGHDSLLGQYGDDVLYGGAGNDRLTGDGDSEYAFGNDRLIGGKGNDTLLGIEGADTIFGGSGRDRIVDGDDDYSQNDRMEGGGGADTLIAGLGSDTLKGGAGADVLRGKARSEAFTGDVLDGGKGSDRMYGSAGFDDFIFTKVAKGDVDVLFRFDLSRDEVDFGGGPLDADTATFRRTGKGADTLVRLDLDDGVVTLRFKGISMETLEANWDFIQA